MGCGTSRAAPVVNEDAPGNQEEGLDTQPQNTEELTSVHSNSPDRNSRPIKSPKPTSPSPILRSNGTEHHPLSAPESPTKDDPPEGLQEEDDLPLPLSAGGGRAIAFEVAPQEDQGESLIKRHPPRKFQKLEDQQQNTSLTQEILEEKQAIAEKRRQEILTQRVQSAKTRTARSAGGRMRSRGSETDEVDQFMEAEELDWISLVNVYAINAPEPFEL